MNKYDLTCDIDWTNGAKLPESLLVEPGTEWKHVDEEGTVYLTYKCGDTRVLIINWGVHVATYLLVNFQWYEQDDHGTTRMHTYRWSMVKGGRSAALNNMAGECISMGARI
jgi:hypothetical protein